VQGSFLLALYSPNRCINYIDDEERPPLLRLPGVPVPPKPYGEFERPDLAAFAALFFAVTIRLAPYIRFTPSVYVADALPAPTFASAAVIPSDLILLIVACDTTFFTILGIDARADASAALDFATEDLRATEAVFLARAESADLAAISFSYCSY
jgi:hypothetical protein